MALTVNQAKKNFRSGKTFWRCLPSADGSVYIEEVLLLGKRIEKGDDCGGSKFKIIGADRPIRFGVRAVVAKQGSYYLTDLCGWGIAKAFDSRRKAQRFAEDFKNGRYPEVQALIQEREEEDRLWSSPSNTEDYYP